MAEKEGHDAAFIHTKENVFYLTDFYTDPHERLMGLFLFQEQEPFFVCPGMEAGQARGAGWEHGIIGYGDHEDPWELIKAELTKRNVRLDSIAVEKDSISLPAQNSSNKLQGRGICFGRRNAQPIPSRER